MTRLALEARLRVVLVVDEAQYLRNDVLEELRLLTNYEMDSQRRLTLLLCGQAELRRRLALQAHEPLNQRILVRYHHGGLQRDDFASYLAHHLRRAGTELALFEPAAVEALFQGTQGLPRKVNLLAHHALNAAALARAKTVTAEHVTAALPEVAHEVIPRSRMGHEADRRSPTPPRAERALGPTGGAPAPLAPHDALVLADTLDAILEALWDVHGDALADALAARS